MSTENIMMVEFSENYAGCGTSMVALFDKRDIMEEEVYRIIRAYPIGYDRRIVFMTKDQFKTVFRSIQKNEEE